MEGTCSCTPPKSATEGLFSVFVSHPKQDHIIYGLQNDQFTYIDLFPVFNGAQMHYSLKSTQGVDNHIHNR